MQHHWREGGDGLKGEVGKGLSGRGRREGGVKGRGGGRERGRGGGRGGDGGESGGRRREREAGESESGGEGAIELVTQTGCAFAHGHSAHTTPRTHTFPPYTHFVTLS